MNRPLIGALSCTAAGLAMAALFGCDSGNGTTPAGSGGASATTSNVTSGAPTTTNTTTGPGGTTTTGPGSTTSTASGNPGGSDTVSDCTNGTGSILTAMGRQGSWYTYNDLTVGGTQTPTAGLPFTMDMPGSTGCMFAAHTKGGGFTVWGSGMAFDLNNPGAPSPKAAYDASAYTGISFWAKAGAGADATGMTMQVIVMDEYSTPEGGKCVENNPPMGMGCDDGPAVNVALTSTWTQYSYKWADLKQANYGLPDPGGTVATTALYAIQFKAGPMATFDTWVDDVAFTK